MSDEILCRCGFVRMLDPSVSCKRGTVIHAVSHCEDTCDNCATLRADLAKAREEAERLTKEHTDACEAADHLVALHNHFATLHNSQQAAWDGWAEERATILRARDEAVAALREIVNKIAFARAGITEDEWDTNLRLMQRGQDALAASTGEAK